MDGWKRFYTYSLSNTDIFQDNKYDICLNKDQIFEFLYVEYRIIADSEIHPIETITSLENQNCHIFFLKQV